MIIPVNPRWEGTAMEWEQQIVTALKQNGVEMVAYLPDGALSRLIELVENDPDIATVGVAREEEAVGVLSGAWLGGTRGALMCQSSGLANTLNAVGSLNKPARIPFVGLVSRRGELGEFNLAQVPFGYGMPAILDVLGVRNHSLDSDRDLENRVGLGVKTAFSTEEPYVLMLESTLTGEKDEF